jgi:hypothetical protein
MCHLRWSCLPALVLVCGAGPGPAQDKPSRPDADRADSILSDAPLTIVFRKVRELPRDGLPREWTYSINSAGGGELTVEYMPDFSVPARKQPTRQKFEVPADKMDAIRKALRVERFFNLADADGPHMIHGGWTTLAVVAGPLAATQRLSSTDWGNWNGDQHKAAAPAMRLFVAVCEAVDPDAKVFTELPRVKRVVADLKK